MDVHVSVFVDRMLNIDDRQYEYEVGLPLEGWVRLVGVVQYVRKDRRWPWPAVTAHELRVGACGRVGEARRKATPGREPPRCSHCRPPTRRPPPCLPPARTSPPPKVGSLGIHVVA